MPASSTPSSARRLAIAVLAAAALSALALLLPEREAPRPTPAPETPPSEVAVALHRPALRDPLVQTATAAAMLAEPPADSSDPPEAVRDPSAPNGALEGRVISASSGAGIAGAEVTFAREGSAESVTSGPGGRFAFAPSRPGEYHLAAASADGYLPITSSPVTFNAHRGVRVRRVTIRLPALHVCSGQILGPGRVPIAGAEIKLSWSGSPPSEPLHSGPDGLFDFEAPERFHLEARHPPFAPASLDADGEGNTDRHFVLELGPAPKAPPGESISGRVLAGGAPVRGASVIARAGEAKPLAAETDAEGRFTLAAASGVAAWNLEAHAEGRGSASLEGVAPGAKGLVLALAGGRQIRGHVLGAERAPVEGAQVLATIAGDDDPPLATAVSDSSGAFTLSGLGPGEYTVRAAREPARAKVEHVAAGTADLVLELPDGGRIAGQVTDAVTGAPVPTFTVDVGGGPSTPRADADGRYEVGGLTPGTWTLSVRADGYAGSDRVTVTVDPPPGKPARADFTLRRGGCLRGQVVDAQTRRPIAGAVLTRFGAQIPTAPALSAPSVTVSGGSGDFELCGLLASRQTFDVQADGYRERWVSAVDGTRTGGTPTTIELRASSGGGGFEYVGIGLLPDTSGQHFMVRRVFPDGSAQAAGLAAGNEILAVDGLPFSELGPEGTVEHIRGLEGTSVRLTVAKPGGAPLDLLVERRRIISPER